MPNLGTKAGELIPSGGKIAGGGTNPLIVSDLMSYGSFSGADIKVIAHYPQRNKKHERIITETRLKKEADVLKYIEFYERNAQGFLTPEQALEVKNEIEILNRELQDIDAQLEDIRNLPTSKTLGEMQTISWGIYRDKAPVRTLGSVYPRAFTRGPRTISGTMIFTIFYEHVFHELMRANLRYYNTGTSDFDRHLYTTMLPDQLPPIDISLIFANEYGAVSHMGIFGVEFFQEGGTFSIEDIYSEATVQYVARDLDPMRTVDRREIDSHGVTDTWTNTASDILTEEQLGRSGTVLRRNPFI
jgi:hypothetical protein